MIATRRIHWWCVSLGEDAVADCWQEESLQSAEQTDCEAPQSGKPWQYSIAYINKQGSFNVQIFGCGLDEMVEDLEQVRVQCTPAHYCEETVMWYWSGWSHLLMFCSLSRSTGWCSRDCKEILWSECWHATSQNQYPHSCRCELKSPQMVIPISCGITQLCVCCLCRLTAFWTRWPRSPRKMIRELNYQRSSESKRGIVQTLIQSYSNYLNKCMFVDG